ncbi:MAG: hypothetical protein WCV59_02200 [Parcubacteria group bacterium]|jgi:hypothetical protein
MDENVKLMSLEFNQTSIKIPSGAIGNFLGAKSFTGFAEDKPIIWNPNLMGKQNRRSGKTSSRKRGN